MNTRTIPHPSRRRRRRIAVVLTALASAVVIAFAVQQSLAAASADAVQEGTSTAPPPAPSEQIDGTVIAPSEADGVIRDGDQPTVFDVDRVAVGNLDPVLLAALQRAATDAEGDGVTFLVNSG